MECDRGSQFNDDSSKIDEKTKESILLMKKKMLRSHDLILQYNNKLKECERLKGDLCSAQEEATKLKRESNANLAKVVKLEMLNAEYKKSQQDLERKIADKDILIAGDKCHLQQLVCKVDDIEDKHSEKLMALELEKSSLEMKVKNLEQELKVLRKSHLSEVNKLEKAINGLPPKPRRGAIKMVKDTKDIGVNTVSEPERAKPVKPATAEKSVLTDEFYHVTDNPYPLFCDKCESSIEPSVEKICKVMTTHPPLLTEILSPVRRHEKSSSADLSRIRRDSRSTESTNLNCSHKVFSRNDLDSNETCIDLNRIDPEPRNFVSPIDSSITNDQSTSVARPMDTVNLEIENLRQKVETLERKMKKRKKQKSSEAHPLSASCCGQSRSLNCCGHSQAHSNQVPNLFANGQLDMMTEFWKRMTMFTNEPAPTLEPHRKTAKNKFKLRRLRNKEKLKNTKKLKNCGSTFWEIESADCQTEMNVDNSESKKFHILRIKPNEVDSRESSPAKIASDRCDESTEKGSYVETASNRASPVKVPDKTDDNSRRSVCSFADVEDANMDVESSTNDIVGHPELITSSKLPTSQIQNSSDGETTNFSQDTESAYFSHNSAGDETASISHGADLQTNCFDANFKNALPTEKSLSNAKEISRNSQKSPIDESVSVCSESNVSDAPVEEDFDANLQDRLATRKRKRSFSPKATKRTTRSMDSLFGKIRALKKNPVVGVARTRRSNIYETRNRRKITNGAETEENDSETVSNDWAFSVCESEPDAQVPAKKQRIAHVPKNEKTSRKLENFPAKKSRQSAKQIGKKIGEKSPKCPKPTTRSSILNEKKLDEFDTKSCDKSSTLENRKIGATEVCRQDRTRAKRNTPIDSTLRNDQLSNGKLEDQSSPKIFVISSINESLSQPDVRVSMANSRSSDNRDNLSREIFNDHEDLEKTANISESISSSPEENNKIGQSFVDETPKPVGTKLCEISNADIAETSEIDSRKMSEVKEKNCSTLLKDSNATSESDSSEAPDEQPISKVPLTEPKQIVGDPKDVLDESEVRPTPRESVESAAELAIPTETAELDSPASPASEEIDSQASPVSCSSLEKFPTDLATIALSPIRSPLYSNVKLTEPSTVSHSGSIDEKSTNFANNLELAISTESSKDLPNSTKSILFQKLTERSSTLQLESSKNFVSLPRILDEGQTADPENAQRRFSNHHLPALPGTHPVSRAKNRQQRSSINKAALQISSTSTLPDDSSNRPKDTKIAENHADVEFPVRTTSVTISSSNSAEKSSDEPKICDITKNVSAIPKSTKIAENRADVEISAEKSLKIDEINEKLLTIAKFTKGPERVPVVYDANLQDDVDRELDAEIDSSPRFFVDTSDSKNKKKTKRPANDDFAATKVVKELRSRQVLSGPATAAIQRNSPMTKNSKEETVDRIPYSRKIVCPGTLLGRHLGALQKKTKVTRERKVAATELYAAAEKTVKAELDKLLESEEWTSELHQSVIASLRKVHSPRTVAKSIVDLLVERAALDEPLDRTYTPPAPVMTKSQQRIATLLHSLDRDGIMSGVFKLVQDGIEFTLFRLNNTQEVNVVEGLVRIFTAMARMRKDRERVRILCCDSLYCLARTAFIVIHIVLSVWPEAFPMHGTCEDELPNCIAHLIKMEQGSKATASKIMALKRMITAYYNYPQCQAPSGVIMKGLIQALRKNYTDDLEAAVLLLAKREGPDWAYDNIINGGLMKMVDDSSYSSSFNALSLLGFLMRTFPLADPLGVMENIGNKLYKMMESGEATPDQQEGVVSALLSLTRQFSQFEKITNIVLSWKPSQTMRIRTTEQLNGLFRMRSLGHWTMRNQLRVKNNNTLSERNDEDEKES